MGREGAITGLQCHIVDAVHFVCLVQEASEVLGEGRWRDDGNLIQAGLKTKNSLTIIMNYHLENIHQEHKHKDHHL